MSLKENSRLLIMASVDRGETQVKEAARLLNISTRQVRRLLKVLRVEGAQPELTLGVSVCCNPECWCR